MTPDFAPSAEDVAAFRRDGVVCLRRVFGRRWIELAARGIERSLANPGTLFGDYTGEGRPGRFLSDMSTWYAIPEFREYAFHSPAAGLAGRLMGVDHVVFLEDQWFLKAPGTATRTPWHQDLPYYDVEGTFCSVWMPLDPMTRENGAEFVRGSHLWGRLYMPIGFREQRPLADPARDGDGRYEPMPDIEARRAAYDIVAWDLEPGDCIVFSARTVHGAPGNVGGTGPVRRLATRWAAPDARYAPKGVSWSGLAEGHGLAPGAPLACPHFPVVWRAGAAG